MGDGYLDEEWEPSKRRRISYLTPEEIEAGYAHPQAQAHGPEGYLHGNLANCKNRFIHQNVEVAFGEGFGKVGSIADMSCGDARVARSLAEYSGIEPILGDYGDWNDGYQYQGPLSETVPQLPVVDLYICTNTIEHLNDPDADLKLIREHCHNMLLSCPIDEYDAGGEHLWFWSREGVEDIFKAAGFEQLAYCELDENPVWEHFKFGIWALR